MQGLIGNTPLVKLTDGIYAKLEFFNPTGSVKDRTALYMINAAERAGRLNARTPIIEPTSGNTGIAIAAISAAKGYTAVLVMPANMSVERRKFISAYGAEIVLTDPAEGMKGAVERARSLANERGGVILNQFENPANPEAHFATGREIWEAACGRVDFLVAGVGTGGTITGAGRYLKSKNPAVKVIAVEPAASPVISGGKAGAHAIQGIGAGFVPAVLDRGIIDGVITVGDGEAMAYAREVACRKGLFVGISSGAALCAATRIAAENRGKNIAVVFPDSGDRYLSAKSF